MSNTFGRVLRLTTFGESHGVALGGVLDGVPAGVAISEEIMQTALDRRRPGQSALTTPRVETDRVQILSGVFAGITTGAPLAFVVFNENQRSGDYDALKSVFRPGHADFTWHAKYGHRDHRGGGRSSGRETLARVAAGAVAEQILKTAGLEVIAFAEQIGEIRSAQMDESVIEKNPARAADAAAAEQMAAAIAAAAASGDSLGGVVKIVARGVPAGLGAPVFDKLDAVLGHALLSVGAVKGVEFGEGFALAGVRGSAANDAFVSRAGQVAKATNKSGGVLGGISDGSEIVVRVAVKPTASISAEQDTVDTAGTPQKIRVGGRHDPCIVPRIVPVLQAMTQLVLADFWLASRLDRLG